MTTALALVFAAIAVAIIAQPLFTRRGSLATGRRESAVPEAEEHYRNALADLRDLDLDHELENITDAEFGELRNRYRLRAAAALRELDQEQARRERYRAEIERELFARRSGGATAAAEADSIQKPGSRIRLGPLPIGAAIAAIAVAGIVGLYLRTSASQAAQAPLATLPIQHAHSVSIDPSGQLWVGHHDGLLRSADGRRWDAVGSTADVMSFTSMPDRSAWLVLGHDVLLRSGDDGRTWQPLPHDLPGTDVHGADQGAAGLYTFVVGEGLFLSQNGSRWERLGPDPGQPVSAVAVLPGPPADRVYLASGGTVIRTADAGRTWTAASGAANGALGGTVRSVAADAAQGALYAATSDGLYRSMNGGSDWVRLPFRGSVAAVGARGPQVALVDDQGQFFWSHDGGGTWTAD
jgi:photosystem II stability/assembly factor-like uncharacterized protein